MKTQVRPKEGFTIVEIMIVCAIIGLLAAIAIPAFARSRSQAQQKACWNNLLKLNEAVDQWALDHRKKTGDPVVADEVLEYIKGGMPHCPSGGTYNFNTVNDFTAWCSFNSGEAPHYNTNGVVP